MINIGKPARTRLYAVSLALIAPFTLALSCGGGSSGSGQGAKSFALDQATTQQDLKAIASEPHVFGSPRQKEVATYIVKRINGMQGFKAVVSAFTAKVPNPALVEQPAGMYAMHLEKSGRNIFGFSEAMKPSDCVVLVASHYDSKRTKGFIYRGANDSGSSSVALLALMDHWQQSAWLKDAACKPVTVFFDGEEAYLRNWFDGRDNHPAGSEDNTYGSRYEADRLSACSQDSSALCLPKELGGYRVAALVLLDMIGSPNVSLNLEERSHGGLKSLALAKDKVLFPDDTLFKDRKPIEVLDDHIPFVEKGLPAINLIDFNNLQTWHKPGDDIESLALTSIERVSILTDAMIMALADGKVPGSE